MRTPEVTIGNRVVLFTDVHDYSIACRRLAGGFYSFLQEMYQDLGDIVVEYEGEIVKYIGDAMLCLFPAGSEQRVVECALRLRRAFSSIVEERGLPPDVALEVGIGSGEVATGVFGHWSLRQKDVFGEAVNRAAKIGHHRGVAITERVYEGVKTAYKIRRLPDVQVKWQEEPLKVWEVVG